MVFTQENPHLLELEINVLPEFRRRGIGRALHEEALRLADGRTTFLGEGQPADRGRGGRAALRRGAGLLLENTAMYRTNERFGFRPVETLVEMQKRL